MPEVERPQAPKAAPVILTLSLGVVHSAVEAKEKYHKKQQNETIASLPRVIENSEFLNKIARHKMIVVSSDGIRFARSDGVLIGDPRNAGEGWFVYKDGVFVKSNKDDAEKFLWHQRVHFIRTALDLIKSKDLLLVAADHDTGRFCMDVYPYTWNDNFDAHVVIESKPVARPVPHDEQVAALADEIGADMKALQEKVEKLSKLVRPAEEKTDEPNQAVGSPKA